MRLTLYRVELDEQHPILVKEKSYNYLGKENITSPDNAVRTVNDIFHLNKLAEEHVYMIAVDQRSKPIGMFCVSAGTVSMSICNPREIFIRALLCGAVGIIIMHNHPSGDPTPSEEDIKTAKMITKAAGIMKIEMLDFIIVGSESYYSFIENRNN